MQKLLSRNDYPSWSVKKHVDTAAFNVTQMPLRKLKEALLKSMMGETEQKR